MDPRYDEAYQRGFDGEAVVPESAAAVEDRVDDRPDEAVAERRNPWLAALWAVSAGLVALSVISFGWLVVTLSSPGATDGPFFIPFLLLPPALFVGGAFGFVVAIALHAFRAERADDR